MILSLVEDISIKGRLAELSAHFLFWKIYALKTNFTTFSLFRAKIKTNKLSLKRAVSFFVVRAENEFNPCNLERVLVNIMIGLY